MKEYLNVDYDDNLNLSIQKNNDKNILKNNYEMQLLDAR